MDKLFDFEIVKIFNDKYRLTALLSISFFTKFVLMGLPKKQFQLSIKILFILVFLSFNCNHISHPNTVSGKKVKEELRQFTRILIFLNASVVQDAFKFAPCSSTATGANGNSATTIVSNNQGLSMALFLFGEENIPKLEDAIYYKKESITDCKRKITTTHALILAEIQYNIRNCEFEKTTGLNNIPINEIARLQCKIKEADFIQID